MRVIVFGTGGRGFKSRPATPKQIQNISSKELPIKKSPICSDAPKNGGLRRTLVIM